MPKYTVHMSQVVSVTIEIEADDAETAAEEAYQEAPSGVCAQCSGWGEKWSRDDSGELEVDAVEDESGAEVFTDDHVWQRTLIGGKR